MNYLALAASIFTAAVSIMYLGKVIFAATGRGSFVSNTSAILSFLILAASGTATVWPVGHVPRQGRTHPARTPRTQHLTHPRTRVAIQAIR